jgi:signal transduction histidine kinase
MMTRLIDDLSDLADADAGALRWQADRVAARSVVDDCIAWLELRDPSAGHRIDNDIPADGATLWADATRVRQILLNLLGNALKYSDGRVSVTARTDGAQMCLTVHDEGPGLDAVQIQRAFEPFERLGQERGPQVGSGLGLAVCRRLTRLMGGDVEVSSTPGAGSAFTIVLPRADPPARP